MPQVSLHMRNDKGFQRTAGLNADKRCHPAPGERNADNG